MRAVIMAGGKGTRLVSLSSVSSNLPKPMFPVLGKPILKYQIESLKRSGVKDITLVVGYKKKAIKDYFGDGQAFGVNIDYIEEDEPLGTAGALYYLKDGKNRRTDDFLLLFGDLMLDVDFNRFMGFHKKKQEQARKQEHNALITLFGHPNSHPYDSDLLVIDEHSRVIEILKKNEDRNFYYHNFVNAGLYCVNSSALQAITKPEKLDLEKDIISGLIRQGNIYAYRSTEYVKDMGTPDRLKAVEQDVKSGIVYARNLRNKQKAIFLDRDGTINEYVGFLRDINDFKLLTSVAEAVAKINASSYLTIVATNQPVIARGEVTFQELDEIHKKMATELGEQGAYLDDIFFCPHHPHKGYEGEVPELKIDCNCRKPKIGMLEQAAKKYNIDLESSWFVGDTEVDVLTGKNAGMKTIQLLTGEIGQNSEFADYVAVNLLEAINLVMENG